MKILIYGSGDYCDLYLANKKKQKDIILGIVDGNSEKWGLKKHTYVIDSPEIIRSIPYEKLIIAVAGYESVIDELLKRKISTENVFVYDGKKNILFSLPDVYEAYLEKKIYRKAAVRQVKTGLLMESYEENEYCGFERIIIVGEEEDYFVINEFFSEVDQYKKIISYDENMLIREDDKIIFCGKNFKSDLAHIRTELFSEQQWVVIPLFDIEKRINL